MKIVIVGAGIGGMTLALALQRQGIDFEVYEKAPELGEVGAGVTLWPNATRVLFELGLYDELTAIAVECPSQTIFHFQTHEPIKVYPRGAATRAAYGAPLYQLHRRDLHDVLVKALEARAPGRVHLAHDAVSIDQLPSGGARVTFSNGAVAEGDLVVGCDGIRSNIRQAIFGKEDPLFTKIIAWRALVPADRLSPEFLENPTGVHIGPDSNVTHYLVRGGTLVNYLCFARVEAWEEEGWRIPSKLEPVMERFKDYHPLIRELIAATPPENLFKWGLFDRDSRPVWSQGAVTLLGDAAHPMLPFLGQGAGMVIEDAMVLSRALTLYPDLPEALSRYEEARRERTKYALDKSRQHSKYYNSHPDDANEDDLAHEIDLCEYNAMTVAI